MMKRSIYRGIAVGLACLPMIVPPAACAAAPRLSRSGGLQKRANSRQAEVVDVALRDRGQLAGRVIVANGTAVAGIPVSVTYCGQAVARTATDTQGRFTLVGLRGGVYQISTPGATRSVRLWAPQTAPPTARQAVTLVARPQTVVRGQSVDAGPGPITKSLIIGGVVATAVAVPLATHNHTTHSAHETE